MKKVSRIREPVNALTHFSTFIAAIVGFILLVFLTRNDATKLVVMSIYGASVIALYGASTIYHWVRTIPRRLLVLRKLDHAAIYLLIAGSYTPVLYYGLTGVWRRTMLIVVWVLAAIGILTKIWLIFLPRWISTLFYLIFGWIALVPFTQLISSLPLGAIILMIAGGAAYTVGAVIYATKRLNILPNLFGFHEVFHLFVMAGSIAHYLMMFLYILPLETKPF